MTGQGVRDTSLKAYEEAKTNLGEMQQLVFNAIETLGPCHDNRILEYLRQGEKLKPAKWSKRRQWEKSDITGRRNQLIAKGVIRDMSKRFGFWYDEPKWYHFWCLTNKTIEPVGWYKSLDDMPQATRERWIAAKSKKVSKKPAALARPVAAAGLLF